METREAAARWVEAWTRGLADADVEAVAAAYTDDATFRSHPFRDPESPRGYAERILADGPVDESTFGVPLVDGDRAAVEYRVVAGGEIIAGVTVLRFRGDGLAVEHRDYWDATAST
jgi:ketosteroid isomerase-like protein